MERRVTFPKSKKVSVLMEASSKEALKDILLQGEKYMTWIPFEKTESRAKLYLKDGRPFSILGKQDKSVLATIGRIRNAIAHRSPHAMNEFKRKVIASLALLPREKTPAGFLRSTVSSTPPQNRYAVYINELERISIRLWTVEEQNED